MNIRLAYAFLILVTFVPCAYPEGFRVRLREHFEIHKISIGGQSTTYKGFSNTANIWYEKPFHYSIGLAGGPILGSAKNKNNPSAMLGSSLKLFTIGAEGKYFPYRPLEGLFTRAGLGWAHLDGNGTAGNLNGWNLYLGLGWEFKVWKLGIAPEFAIRYTDLESGASVFSITPSIGVHFYVLGPKADSKDIAKDGSE